MRSAPPRLIIEACRNTYTAASAWRQYSYWLPVGPLLRSELVKSQSVAAGEASGRRDETVSIRARNGTLTSDGKRAAQSNVETLAAALRAPIIPAPDPANLGVTPPWLDQQIADPRGRFRLEAARATASQRALLTNTLKDRQKIERVVPTLFSYVRMDDYPGATVEVTFDDGTKLTAETHSYYPFMLPWSLGIQREQTYNADISRAVANLLGKKSPNKDRLAGSTFPDELVETTKRSIDREWNLLGSEDRAGDALAALRASYEVVASEIGPYHHSEYGTATYKGEPEQVNLHATLRKSSFPPGVTVALVLARVQGRVEGIDRFLSSAEKYENLALSVRGFASTSGRTRVSQCVSHMFRTVRSATRRCGRLRRTCDFATGPI